jgi:hypothetical protein
MYSRATGECATALRNATGAVQDLQLSRTSGGMWPCRRTPAGHLGGRGVSRTGIEWLRGDASDAKHAAHLLSLAQRGRKTASGTTWHSGPHARLGDACVLGAAPQQVFEGGRTWRRRAVTSLSAQR